jgi:hypothetical protein
MFLFVLTESFLLVWCGAIEHEVEQANLLYCALNQQQLVAVG